MNPAGQPPKQPQQPSSSSMPLTSTTPATRNWQNAISSVPSKSSSGELAAQAMANSRSFEGRRSARGSKDSLTQKQPRQSPSPVPALNHNDELLKTLKTEFDTLRNIITCKICYGILYEPYTTSCGHTYCYSCLCKSFRPNTQQSCPECRTMLSQAPAPAFLVRELTHTFIKRAELLPTGETLEQHLKWQKEHAEIITRDKDNTDRHTGGLWKGFFRPRPRPRRALRDIEDGVDRCPYCTWELEDGMCTQCGLPFDQNGTGQWNFSDMDETSEHELNSELGFDVEVDMEEDMDDMMDDGMFDDETDGWFEEYDLAHPAQSYAIRRFLEGASLRQRPRAAHSAAASRRRSYAASLASDMPDSEMAILEEEEDEDADEDEDENDSSMNDFIEDDEIEATGSHVSASTSDSRSLTENGQDDLNEVDEDSEEDEAPIPSGRRRQQQQVSSAGANRHQNAASTLNSGRGTPSAPTNTNVIEIDQTPSGSEAEEDEGPIAPSRRRFRATQSQRTQTSSETSRNRTQQTQAAPGLGDLPSLPTWRQASPRNTSLGSRPIPPQQARAPSSGPSETSQVSMRAFPTSMGYAPLGGRGSQLDEEAVDEGEESDGGRTTVGWEPITTSLERTRNTGSLTPTADRPNPHNRPVSRAGAGSFPLGTRGIRRRSSVLSISTVHYEDNDADDDVSDGDPDSEVEISTSALRQQTARLQQRNMAPTYLRNSAQSQPFSDMYDVDSDDTDISQVPSRHGQQARRQEEYDPRISLLFAQHMTDVRDVDYHHPVTRNDIEQLRASARTPVARPRSTVNRNRLPGVSSQGVLLNSPEQVSRTVQPTYAAQRSRNSMVDSSSTVMPSPNSRSITEHTLPGSGRSLANDSHRTPTLASRDVVNTSAANSSIISSPQSITRATPQYATSLSASPTSVEHPGDTIDRPMSRMNSRPSSAAGRRGATARPPFSPPQFTSMGPGLNSARTWQINSRNPFYTSLRPRQSTQRLREQSSTATLRSRGSRILRNQPSVINVRDTSSQNQQMRPQASRIQLRSQPSSHRLQGQPSLRAMRAAETALTSEPSPYASSSNPFTRPYRQSVPMNSNTSSNSTPVFTHAPPRNSNGSNPGAQYHHNTAGMPSQGPAVSRRRSNRGLAVSNTATGAAAPFPVLQNANTGYIRARAGQSPGASSQESYFSATTSRGVSQVSAGGELRRS